MRVVKRSEREFSERRESQTGETSHASARRRFSSAETATAARNQPLGAPPPPPPLLLELDVEAVVPVVVVVVVVVVGVVVVVVLLELELVEPVALLPAPV